MTVGRVRGRRSLPLKPQEEVVKKRVRLFLREKQQCRCTHLGTQQRQQRDECSEGEGGCGSLLYAR